MNEDKTQVPTCFSHSSFIRHIIIKLSHNIKHKQFNLFLRKHYLLKQRI